jgi:integrase
VAHTATIQRRVYRGKLGPAKGRNVRVVHLGPGLVRDLRRLRKEHAELALSRGTRAATWVFQNRAGSCWGYNSARRTWKAAVTEAGLLAEGETLREVKLGTHALRHTYATQRLQEGVPPADVAEVLGDSLPTLYRVYAHAMPEENRDRLKVDLDAII